MAVVLLHEAWIFVFILVWPIEGFPYLVAFVDVNKWGGGPIFVWNPNLPTVYVLQATTWWFVPEMVAVTIPSSGIP